MIYSGRYAVQTYGGRLAARPIIIKIIGKYKTILKTVIGKYNLSTRITKAIITK